MRQCSNSGIGPIPLWMRHFSNKSRFLYCVWKRGMDYRCILVASLLWFFFKKTPCIVCIFVFLRVAHTLCSVLHPVVQFRCCWLQRFKNCYLLCYRKRRSFQCPPDIMCSCTPFVIDKVKVMTLYSFCVCMCGETNSPSLCTDNSHNWRGCSKNKQHFAAVVPRGCPAFIPSHLLYSF